MRPNDPSAPLLALALALPFMLLADGAAAQGRPSDLDARMRALEARVEAIERRSGAGADRGPVSAGVDCEAFGVAFRAGQTRLSIVADGRRIGSFEERGSPILTSLLRRGPNTIVFAFASPGNADTLLQAYCTPPGADQRVEILRFKPEPGALEAQVAVNMTPPGR